MIMNTLKIRLKRVLSFALVLISISHIFAITVFADEKKNTLPPEPPLQYATAACLYNLENDRILYEYNAASTVYPASTVKLMTAIVVFEEHGDLLHETITITQAMANEFSGNRIGLYVDEIVTYEQMLSCMLVNSANDAAIVLAHAVAGNTEDFVSLMNQKAAELGAFGTHYTNPTGMHSDSMVTTARDTLLIAKHAYSIPGFIEITSTPRYVMNATNKSDYRNVNNRNCMISKFYSGDYYYSRAVGMNAGATTQGGYALCGAATDDSTGLTYIAIVLGAESVDGILYNYKNAISMFDWAFEAYGYTKVLSSTKRICEVPVSLSSTIDYVTLVPRESITVYLPTSVDVERDIRYSYNTYAASITAPVEAGTEAGTITVLLGDEILGSCPLITTSSIARSEFLFFLEKIKIFSQGRFFRAMLVSVVVLSVLYVIVKAIIRERKLRRRLGRR